MNNLKVLVGISMVLVVNALILTSHNILALSAVFSCVYLLGYLFLSKKRVLKRLTTFLFIGVTLLLFQMVFNQAVPVADRLNNAVRVTLQLATISQIVFLMVQYVSPSSLISALWFLPRTWQLLLTMTFSAIPNLIREQEFIQIAQQSRGVGLTWKSKLLSPVASFVPIVHRILQRSETIGLTMVSRGFMEA